MVIVRLTDVVTTGETARAEPTDNWVIIGRVVKQVFGAKVSGRVGYSRGTYDSCDWIVPLPVKGDEWVFYYRDNGRRPDRWLKAFPVSYARTFDSRLSADMRQ